MKVVDDGLVLLSPAVLSVLRDDLDLVGLDRNAVAVHTSIESKKTPNA